MIKMKKTLLIFVAIVTVLLMVSSATVVSQTQASKTNGVLESKKYDADDNIYKPSSKGGLWHTIETCTDGGGDIIHGSAVCFPGTITATLIPVPIMFGYVGFTTCCKGGEKFIIDGNEVSGSYALIGYCGMVYTGCDTKANPSCMLKGRALVVSSS